MDGMEVVGRANSIPSCPDEGEKYTNNPPKHGHGYGA
jgi:hypothetical protein